MAVENEATPSCLRLPAELLEAILLQVDMRTILVSSLRVCKRWNAIITNSPSLQRHLFFLEDEIAAPTHNTLLQNHFPFLFQHAVDRETVPDFFALSKESMEPDGDLPFPHMPWLSANRDAYARPEASWHLMLVHQPPLYDIGRVDTFHSACLSNTEPLFKEHPVCVTQLLRAALRHNPLYTELPPHLDHEIPKSSFRVLWYQLPQDIIDDFPLPAKEEDEEDEDNSNNGDFTSNPNALSSELSMLVHDLVAVGRAFRKQMDYFGVVIQFDLCNHSRTTLDPQQLIIYDIMNCNVPIM